MNLVSKINKIAPVLIGAVALTFASCATPAIWEFSKIIKYNLGSESSSKLIGYKEKREVQIILGKNFTYSKEKDCYQSYVNKWSTVFQYEQIEKVDYRIINEVEFEKDNSLIPIERKKKEERKKEVVEKNIVYNKLSSKVEYTPEKGKNISYKVNNGPVQIAEEDGRINIVSEGLYFSKEALQKGALKSPIIRSLIPSVKIKVLEEILKTPLQEKMFCVETLETSKDPFWNRVINTKLNYFIPAYEIDESLILSIIKSTEIE